MSNWILVLKFKWKIEKIYHSSLRPLPSFMNKVYFWFSLLFLIWRTLSVSLYASYIHDESKKTITILRAIPRCSWCKESYRFSEEVVNETVALTGMKFFRLTRTLILTVRFITNNFYRNRRFKQFDFRLDLNDSDWIEKVKWTLWMTVKQIGNDENLIRSNWWSLNNNFVLFKYTYKTGCRYYCHVRVGFVAI